MTARKEFKILTLLYILGVAWLLLNVVWPTNVVVCPIRSVTGMPCPACGTTRGLVHLLHGEPWQAVVSNPNVLLVAPAALVLTLSLVVGWLCRKPFAQQIYAQVQQVLSRKRVFAAFVAWELYVWAFLLFRHFN
ncbi:hypothetical protein HMPREF2955_06640 [Prevotella sp. HMSC073D09]|uniref:DUF2752 domain-containing protein n=1 Tax=Prevotella sp. HMSC073D09 TaxID=1739459 RepID=UPI0008A64A2C|nr:DUF2752 domain-containing protein [Prevotella sp. HMSC073D09]OFQ23701.1 hypothetical protein HMPREF2955_06640 [Prevotella sp. HMSC073D09]